jgi:hypothetical protein
MVLVILAVVQIFLLAILVILFLTKGRSDLQNSVPELMTGLADLRNSAERLEAKASGDMRSLREENSSYSLQARQEAAADSRSLREATTNRNVPQVSAKMRRHSRVWSRKSVDNCRWASRCRCVTFALFLSDFI